MAARKDVKQELLAATRFAAQEYQNATEVQQHRSAVRDFNHKFGLLSQLLRSRREAMPADLTRAYAQIVARNGMLLGSGPSGGSAESELESALQQFDRFLGRNV